jgi:hypothetical protein
MALDSGNSGLVVASSILRRTVALIRARRTPLVRLVLAAGIFACFWMTRTPPTLLWSAPLSGDYDDAFVAYRWANPYESWPLQKQLEFLPELRGMEPARDQAALPEILRRAGDNVEAYVKNFVNTASLETVEESRTRPNGSPDKHIIREQFRYLMLLASANDEELKEYRTDLHGREQNLTNPKAGFVKTSGFASMPLLLSPRHQSLCDYRYLGSQVIDGRRAEVVGFAGHPVPEAVSGQYGLNGEHIPLILQGIAWIDSTGFQILRMRSDLLAPLTFAGLSQLTTNADFHAISFKNGSSVLWLPQKIEVISNFYGRIYRNLHSYSDYQLFTVDTGEHTPTQPPPTPAPPRNM